MTLRQMLASAERRLRATGNPTPRVDSEWLLASLLELNRTELYLWDRPIDAETTTRFERQITARGQGVPLQHLTGFTEFCGHRIAVSPDALIPRPETEILVERAARYLRDLAQTRSPRVLELGTGSGCIAVALSHAVPACQVTAVELSWGALRVAAANVAAHALGERIQLVQADWTSSVRGSFDLVVTNPPYIATSELSSLPRDVRREPVMSLDGGSDGLRFYRRLFADAAELVTSGGAVGVECAEEQADWLRQLVSGFGWVQRVEVFEDLAGCPRGLWIECSASVAPGVAKGPRDSVAKRSSVEPHGQEPVAPNPRPAWSDILSTRGAKQSAPTAEGRGPAGGVEPWSFHHSATSPSGH